MTYEAETVIMKPRTRKKKRYSIGIRALIFVLLIYLIGNPVVAIGQPDPPRLPESAIGKEGPIIRAVKKRKSGQPTETSETNGQRSDGGTATQNPAPRQTSTQEFHPQKAAPEQSQSEVKPGPRQPSQSAFQVGGRTAGPLTDRVLTRKFGSERFQQLLESVKTGGTLGLGSSNADSQFDGARHRTGNEDGVRPAGTQFFQSGISAITKGAFKDTTVQDARATTSTYGSIPGGVVLEGVATGLGAIEDVQYDSRFNAFILDDRAVYFLKVPPTTVAVLCRAIARDEKERVGVSLGKKELVYGEVPKDSDLAWDLKMADQFLGEIVFAQNDWTAGYRFANAFKPQPTREQSYSVAVFFNFNGFEFRVQQQEVELTQANFDVRILPLSESSSSDGGHLPDESAISEGRVPQQFELNARHVADNISYYRQERIVDRVFAYGEVAAFIRELKRSGFDLENLAARILNSQRSSR
jgi:hypothetical protein